jgi:hypothetical protein
MIFEANANQESACIYFILQRVYSVLWGTLLLDFENEEDSKTSLSPKQTSEVLGISEWDGQGRGSNSYPNGLLLVTHTGEKECILLDWLYLRDVIGCNCMI